MLTDKLACFFSSIVIAVALAPALPAQIVPDRTLPANSIVVPGGNGRLIIVGGTTRGTNLFHSFQQFSVPAGAAAIFNNDPAIANIFSRVTGGNVSRIDGILAAAGRANLFLVNPNGIIFGSGAALALGGSFVATTGESIRFADGGRYSSRNPETSILTVSLPTAISVREPGPIVVEGRGHNYIRVAPGVRPTGIDLSGLRVLPGRSLSLIGGDIRFEGGIAAASSGRLYLGAAGDGTVGLDPGRGFAPLYTDINNFRDITLSKQAILDASGFGGGEIELRGENFLMTDASMIVNTNYGSLPSGPIVLEFSGDVTLIGTTAFNRTNTLETPIGRGIASQTVAGGDSAPIFVTARSLTLSDTAGIGSLTVGKGRGGDLRFNVGRLNVLGASPFDAPEIGSIINTTTVGDAGAGGDIRVNAREVNLGEGGTVTASVYGSAPGGSISVRADRIGLSGYAGGPSGEVPSGLGTTGLISGPAGNVSIDAGRLEIIDGGLLVARSYGRGNGGNITVRAGEITLYSRSGSGRESAIASSATRPDLDLVRSLSIPNVGDDLLGNAGNVTIEAGRITLSGSGSSISVLNEGRGTAGSIFLNGGRVVLENGARITANSLARDGGNITLRSDLLGLFGGSSITANAVAGNGGNVTIDSRALFSDPSARITASSELGLQGRVIVNSPNFQIAPEAVKFPSDNDFETVATTSCVSGNENNRYRFTITGSGGTGGLPGEAPATLTFTEEPRPESSRGSVAPAKPDRPLSERDNANALISVNGRFFLVRCGGDAAAN
jgi:filamentous hemagglutinin family protein